MIGKSSLLEWETLLNRRPAQGRTDIEQESLVDFCKEWDWGLAGHLLIGWGMYTRWRKSKANAFSLCGVGGETGSTAQEDVKSINSYNMGREG